MEQADSKTVWTAKSFALGRSLERLPSFPDASTPDEINAALISHFFPSRSSQPLPTTISPLTDAIAISTEEVSRALGKSSDASAAGPDQIPYGVWKEVNRANSLLLPALLSPLVQ